MGSIYPGVGRKELLKTSASISSIATIWVLRMVGEGISSGQPQSRTEKLSAPHYSGGAGREQGTLIISAPSMGSFPPWCQVEPPLLGDLHPPLPLQQLLLLFGKDTITQQCWDAWITTALCWDKKGWSGTVLFPGWLIAQYYRFPGRYVWR